MGKISFSKYKTCLAKCFLKVSLFLDVPLLELFNLYYYYTYPMRYEATLESIDCNLFQHSGEIIFNYSYRHQPNIGYKYIVYIHLPGKHYNVNHFDPQAFVSGSQNQVFQVCLCIPLSKKFPDDIVAPILTTRGCSYRLELQLQSCSK